jgi:hypothetical protein
LHTIVVLIQLQGSFENENEAPDMRFNCYVTNVFPMLTWPMVNAFNRPEVFPKNNSVAYLSNQYKTVQPLAVQPQSNHVIHWLVVDVSRALKDIFFSV